MFGRLEAYIKALESNRSSIATTIQVFTNCYKFELGLVDTNFLKLTFVSSSMIVSQVAVFLCAWNTYAA